MCDVISSPPPLNLTWNRGNKSLSASDVAIKSLSFNQSSLVINEEDSLDVFSCIASNPVGLSKPCRLHIPEQNGELK